MRRRSRARGCRARAADPTPKHGEDAAKANALELEGWSHKQRLEGRFSDALDKDADVQEEVRNAARTLVAAIGAAREGRLVAADAGLTETRPK